jgi:hypothetical protein
MFWILDIATWFPSVTGGWAITAGNPSAHRTVAVTGPRSFERLLRDGFPPVPEFQSSANAVLKKMSETGMKMNDDPRIAIFLLCCARFPNEKIARF